MTPEQLEKRMDELARQHAETHDRLIQADLEELGRKIAAQQKRLSLTLSVKRDI
jgi:hypothetical protein